MKLLFNKRFTPRLISGILLLFMFLGFAKTPLQSRVFTPRSGASLGSFDSPQSFRAKEIYSGKFRINGRLADMRILAGASPMTVTLKTLSQEADQRKFKLTYRTSPNMAVGTLGQGESEKRFMISSMGSSRGCLIFVLESAEGLFATKGGVISWPKNVPILDPTQQPQLVVEHLETRAQIVCARIPGNGAEEILKRCREQLIGAGWNVESLTDHTLSQMSGSGLAVFRDREQICWLSAKADSTEDAVLVTLLCRAP